MAAMRILVLFLILSILVNCALAREISREKRFLGCGKVGKRCSGFFGKACCKGTKCNLTSGKCVPVKSSSSWLNDRNGK